MLAFRQRFLFWLHLMTEKWFSEGFDCLLQQTWNSVVPLSSHKLHDRVFCSLSSCSFPFLVYVRHLLNHTIVFLAPSLAQRSRQPPSSPNAGVPNLFTISYHLSIPHCQCVPLLPEQLIWSSLSLFREINVH